jgi:putative membrane protein
MRTFARFAMVMALMLCFGLSVSADENKLIEKKEAKEPTTDQEFLTHAIACEVAEVKISEYVAKNATNEDVRKFATQMVTDHTNLRKELMERAREMKLGVVEGLDKQKQEKFDQLKKLKGIDFDREYMRCMIEGHEKALRFYEKWSDAKTEAIRNTARKAVPTIREHLAHARLVNAKLKN